MFCEDSGVRKVSINGFRQKKTREIFLKKRAMKRIFASKIFVCLIQTLKFNQKGLIKFWKREKLNNMKKY